MENFDKLKEILVDVLGVKTEDIKAESKFIDDSTKIPSLIKAHYRRRAVT